MTIGDGHIFDEMKRAVRSGDSTRADELDATIGSFEAKGADLNFVKASQEVIDLGAERCLVIHKLPDRMDSARIGEYEDYLMRESRRQLALFYYTRERQEYIAVQFPGRPEEVFTLRAFTASLRELLRQKSKSVSAD